MKRYFSLLIVLFFIACSSESDSYKSENEEEILAYIKSHNLTAQKTNSGLYYVIDKQGLGKTPTKNSTVTVNYKGTFTNGTSFDQGRNVTFNLQNVIKGWTEGIPYFNEGGEGFLLIPSHLGYGSKGTNGIPGGSVLVFGIHVLSVR